MNWSHSLQTHTYQVWAVGKFPNVGAAIIWNLGQSSLKPPGGSCEHPVVNCRSLAISSWVKLPIAAQNHPTVLRNSSEFPFTTWCTLKSAISYCPVPHNKSWNANANKCNSYNRGKTFSS